MKSFITCYSGLFGRKDENAPSIERIEIPLIQRDYAQGRRGGGVDEVRDSFLKALTSALAGGKPLSLDFVYGDVQDGTLRPLDGQQRLTTLFLFHWYLASRAGTLESTDGWKRFTYATRPSARMFCEVLVQHAFPAGESSPSEWLEDQPWVLFSWHNDPTISGMLVMLDAIEQHCNGMDYQAGWRRLTDQKSPAISFHLLPIVDLGPPQELYVKMNARGKPLTPFESLKARLERLVAAACPERADELAKKIDGAWSDVFWPFHGGDFLIDQELSRYLHFVLEAAEWTQGREGSSKLSELVDRVFDATDERATEHATKQLGIVIDAFDTWVGEDISAWFERHLTNGPEQVTARSPLKLPIYAENVDLFAECCSQYGERSGRQRKMTLQRTLLLTAVLLHRLDKSADFEERLRMTRNLLNASGDQVREKAMPSLERDIVEVILGADLDAVSLLNKSQVAEEKEKRRIRSSHPELSACLAHLEDHDLLRGQLAVFDLDPDTLARRAEAFHRVFGPATDLSLVTAALLAVGDYSRKLNERFFQLGSSSARGPWRELFTGGSRKQLTKTRAVMGSFLDRVSADGGPITEALQSIAADWLKERNATQSYDWRYYLVRYACMRGGTSGKYVGWDGRLGNLMCMLHKHRVSSYYRDPFLLAVYRQSGVGQAAKDPWFMGYESEPRWLRLAKSGTGIRSVQGGFTLQAPLEQSQVERFSAVCQQFGVDEELLLKVASAPTSGSDQVDRVQLGSQLLKELVAVDL